MDQKWFSQFQQWKLQSLEGALPPGEAEAVLQRLCDELTEYLTKAYILDHYKRELKSKAKHIFHKELHDTLGSMRRLHAKACVQRFRIFVEQGCAAFIKGHPAPESKLDQDAHAQLAAILKREGVPGEVLSSLRRDQALYRQLISNTREAERICYNNIVRSYAVHDLRNESGVSGSLLSALDKACAGTDRKKKYSAQALLSYIPDDYADLYPAARNTARHFILHIGPTNSGKTYAALQAMHHAQDGIYLAPLRLLAYEQFESMNRDGVFCTLRTGEEWIDVPGATMQSSTIEMLDENHYYDTVVIDEAQMVQDPMRGGYWTKAILGAWADEIHVCMAPEAEQIIIRMIEQCKDSYEIIRHERFNELVPDREKNVRFPWAVEPGDAYIVFSRSSAHACVAELQRHGINPSIIYGALPYDVRQNEARRFREGETSVVVATDAIGMGLNLPIRRIVFLETEKFDGVSRRPLLPTEYKQIAGRAGRYGQAERGMYVSPYHMKNVITSVSEPIEPIRYAHLLFPDTLLGVDAPLSKILRIWDGMSSNEGYRKGNVAQEIQLSEILEKYCSDKKLIYSLVSMPFDVKHQQVYELWLTISHEIIRWKDVELEAYIPDTGKLNEKTDMKVLEDQYRQLDLLYYFAERFDKELIPEINNGRKKVSSLLMTILANSKLPPRVCKSCRKPLPWNSPYALCQHCAVLRRAGLPQGDQ